jgi:hypothetical protein
MEDLEIHLESSDLNLPQFQVKFGALIACFPCNQDLLDDLGIKTGTKEAVVRRIKDCLLCSVAKCANHPLPLRLPLSEFVFDYF